MKLKKNDNILLLITNTRSGSTFLYDILRTFHNIKIYKKFDIYNLFHLKGRRYPMDLSNIEGKEKNIEVWPGKYEKIKYIPKALQKPIFNKKDNYYLEKLHPHFFDHDIPTFLNNVKSVRNDRKVKLLFHVREPLDSINSFNTYKKRNPFWAKDKILPEFLLKQYESIQSLINYKSDMVTSFRKLMNNRKELLNEISNFLWDEELTNDEVIIMDEFITKKLSIQNRSPKAKIFFNLVEEQINLSIDNEELKYMNSIYEKIISRNNDSIE